VLVEIFKVLPTNPHGNWLNRKIRYKKQIKWRSPTKSYWYIMWQLSFTWKTQ